MAKNDSEKVVICDAGPIIHLHELYSLDLLSGFHSLIIPKTVQVEISKHRPGALQQSEVCFNIIDVISPADSKLLTLSKVLAIDKGELDCLSLMHETPENIFLTDDAAARLTGEELGYRVHGTIGIILRAIRRNLKTPKEVLKLLNDIPIKTTLFIRPTLLKDIMKKVEDEYKS